MGKDYNASFVEHCSDFDMHTDDGKKCSAKNIVHGPSEESGKHKKQEHIKITKLQRIQKHQNGVHLETKDERKYHPICPLELSSFTIRFP